MASKTRKRSTPARQQRSAEEELKAFRIEQELAAERKMFEASETATAQAIEDLELPDLVFDWGDLDWRASQEISKALSNFGRMDQEYDAGGNYVPMEVRNEMQDEAFDTIRFWFSNVCVSIPVDWFTRATQEEVKAGKRSLDFSDPETYFDLKDVRTGRLISALNQDRGHSEKN